MTTWVWSPVNNGGIPYSSCSMFTMSCFYSKGQQHYSPLSQFSNLIRGSQADVCIDTTHIQVNQQNSIGYWPCTAECHQAKHGSLMTGPPLSQISPNHPELPRQPGITFHKNVMTTFSSWHTVLASLFICWPFSGKTKLEGLDCNQAKAAEPRKR